MRRFFIQNEIGERRSLQVRGELFFNSPTGLGFADTNTYAHVDGFFVRTYSEPMQGSIAGEFVFGGYAAYKNFVDWVFSGYDLALGYMPGDDEYLCDIDITSLSKGELHRGVLVCPVIMTVKTPWYRAHGISISLAPPESSVGWSRLPFALPAQFASSGVSSAATLIPAGHMPAAVAIEVAGKLVNPCVTLTDGAGAEIGRMDLNGVTVESGKNLVFSTRFGHVGVSVGGIDMLDKLDISNNNFFSVPQGRASTLALGADNTITTTATVTLYEYFRSV